MNKVALITGGTRGIGFGIAQALADLGFDLAINGVRDEQLVIEVLSELRKKNIKVIYCQGDIALETNRKAILDKIKIEFGQLNLLINNAGVAPKDRKDILETTEESYDFVLDTNLKGTYFLTQAVANFMVEQKNKNQNFQGTIINVSSISATVASVNRGEYCVAKAGLSMVTQLFAVRLGEYNIPVYEIRPGIIKTDMTEKVTEKYDKLVADGLCIQARWGVPSDIGKAVAALAKGDFMYSTGQVFTIDGGLTLARL
jgi:3-oxoacyl-[acyl-carrier protein] reductase